MHFVLCRNGLQIYLLFIAVILPCFVQHSNLPEIIVLTISPPNPKLFYVNFHPLEVVHRYRDAQLQVGENY